MILSALLPAPSPFFGCSQPHLSGSVRKPKNAVGEAKEIPGSGCDAAPGSISNKEQE